MFVLGGSGGVMGAGRRHSCITYLWPPCGRTLAVLVVVAGGTNTLTTVVTNLQKRRPVVIIANSGGVATDIYEYCVNDQLPANHLDESEDGYAVRQDLVANVAPVQMPEIKRLGAVGHGIYGQPLLRFFGAWFAAPLPPAAHYPSPAPSASHSGPLAPPYRRASDVCFVSVIFVCVSSSVPPLQMRCVAVNQAIRTHQGLTSSFWTPSESVVRVRKMR